MYKKCAVCERKIFVKVGWLCKDCLRSYSKDDPWVKALIKLSQREDYCNTQKYQYQNRRLSMRIAVEDIAEEKEECCDEAKEQVETILESEEEEDDN